MVEMFWSDCSLRKFLPYEAGRPSVIISIFWSRREDAACALIVLVIVVATPNIEVKYYKYDIVCQLTHKEV